MLPMVSNYLTSVQKQFQYYKMLGEKTFAQCSDLVLFDPIEADGNSIGVIVNHIAGNMGSRWTDFLTTDGEKEWRNREQEFAEVLKSRQDLLTRWEEGWQCLFSALETLSEENIDTEIYIRNQGHTIIEAVNRQICHYSYHVGQIVLIGKTARGNHWQSLSIPRGGSQSYNAKHFNTSKTTQHFTDDLLS